jgi:hypothetical protein
LVISIYPDVEHEAIFVPQVVVELEPIVIEESNEAKI